MANEQITKEVTAIAAVMADLESLTTESQRRVIWYVADALGLNQEASQAKQVRQQGANTKTIPLPAGTDPRVVTDALRAAGVPVNQ